MYCVRRLATTLVLLLLPFAHGEAEKLAITFDDLPLNGALPANTSRSEIVRNVLAILRENHIGPVYGFVNSKRFEDNADGAEALRLWIAGGQRVGNHTYAHSDLTASNPEQFLQDVRENEPVLELLAA
jgi:peptidoglycan/xylan/chitin deacetylase (PgdA/CDA1 family)